MCRLSGQRSRASSAKSGWKTTTMNASNRKEPTMVAEMQEQERDEPLLISVPQAARLLGIGPTLAWELVHTRVIPSVKLGRRVLVSRTALEQLATAGLIPGHQ